MRFLHDIFQKRCLDVATFKFGCSQNLIVFFLKAKKLSRYSSAFKTFI